MWLNVSSSCFLNESFYYISVFYLLTPVNGTPLSLGNPLPVVSHAVRPRPLPPFKVHAYAVHVLTTLPQKENKSALVFFFFFFLAFVQASRVYLVRIEAWHVETHCQLTAWIMAGKTFHLHEILHHWVGLAYAFARSWAWNVGKFTELINCITHRSHRLFCSYAWRGFTR